MQKTSLGVAVAAAAALVAGSIGMASADPHSAHLDHGHAGENTALASQRTTERLPKLVGIVNADRDIEISDRTPRHGRYRVVVKDSTDAHNWHLYGQGTSIATKVRGTGRWVFKVRLTVGSYRVVCDPHADDMEFDLVVH